MAVASLVLAGAIWGFSFPLMKFAVSRFEPLHLAVYRVTVAAAASTAMALLVTRARWELPGRAQWSPLLVLGLMVGWGQSVAFTYGISLTPATTASLIVPLNPIFTALLAAWWLGERVSARQWFGVGIAGAGMLVLVLRHGGGLEAGHAWGPPLVALAPLSWAVFTVVSKPLLARYHPPVLSAYTTVLGLVWVLPLVRPETVGRLAGASWPEVGVVFYLGAISMAGGFYLWYVGLKRLGAARAGSFALLIPFFGVLGAVLFLGEPVGWALVLGGALILLGIRLVLAPAPRHG